MGQAVDTLEDLLRPGLSVVCVGINPSRVSVEAGHYYQGIVGQRFFRRLRDARVVPPADRGEEDDVAFAAGVGFTDIVKRPTASASELRAEDYQHGRELVLAKLARYKPELVIFTYKKAAVALFGRFAGDGFVPSLQLSHSEVFVMPGPYQRAETVTATMRTLARRFE